VRGGLHRTVQQAEIAQELAARAERRPRLSLLINVRDRLAEHFGRGLKIAERP
jgi:hypothetical protein